ncbi:MAG: hypothetical protein J6X81_04640 [Muribaculaceae bacterium]|nr:hypothetical protein [Muribaculaceae bacterium]
MKRFFLAVTAMMAFSAMQAAIEVPAGSGIYYDWDGDNNHQGIQQFRTLIDSGL